MSFTALDVDHNTWHIIHDLEKENIALKDLNKELVGILEEMKNKFRAEITAAYEVSRKTLINERIFNMDMAIIKKAEALIAKAKGESNG